MRQFRPLGILSSLLLALAVSPAAGETEAEFDEFWNEEEPFQNELPERPGTGGGPLMVWIERDLDAVNRELAAFDLLAVPEGDLYWGGAAWFSIDSGEMLFVALGGGGYGGGSESQRSTDFSRYSNGAGYFAVKGILPVHNRLYLEGGIQLGGGSSALLVEHTEDDGVVSVHLRGDRNYLMARASLGLEFRLARWIGILAEGGYAVTRGDWELEGERALIDRLDFEDEAGAFASLMVRFGI